MSTQEAKYPAPKVSASKKRDEPPIEPSLKSPLAPPRRTRVVELPIDDHLRLAAEAQARVGIYINIVDDYAEAMLAGAIFPPIVVFEEPHRWVAEDVERKTRSTFYVGDGWHRLRAAIKIGKNTITAEVREGGLDGLCAAILHAAGANTEHGIPRSREDRRRAITLILNRIAWRARSDRWIAEICKVDHKTVASVRAEWERAHKVQPGNSPVEPREGKDGKKRRRAAGVPAAEQVRGEQKRRKQHEEWASAKKQEKKEQRKQTKEYERGEARQWAEQQQRQQAEQEARAAERSKIVALIERAAHANTPEEEARTSAVHACRLIMKHGLLDLLRGVR